MARVIRWLFALLMLAMGLAFHVRNDAPVALNYYLGTLEIPHLSWLVIAALLAGAVLGCVAMLGTVLRLRREVRRLAKNNALAGRELRAVHTMPVKDVV